MTLLLGLLKPLQVFVDGILAVGRWISIIAIAFMVLAILIQVFFRYVLGNALPWPDEAARFMMLWMTGLMAPLAYRRGGFVAIDMVLLAFPKTIGAVISLLLLLIASIVLVVAVQIGWAEITGFGGRFATDSLWYPSLDGTWSKVPRSWMMSSLVVGSVLLMIVNVELVLRSVVSLLGGEDRLRPIPGEAVSGAE
jgi:TRAP-type C4-dicarboxylate transport system permease small subunit